MPKIIGIDLGTTNSCIAVMEGEKPVVIANSEGNRTTPSIVAFNKKKELIIGEIAKRQAILNPENTFNSVKRLVGRDLSEVETEVSELNFRIIRDGSRVKIYCPTLEKSFSPEEISARILRKLARDASEYLGEPVNHAIVTVPAYFNDSQRQATRDAGKIAGLEVIRILTEPVAAAISYGLNAIQNQNILVFDLGGGTFDVSVLQIGDNVFEVLSSSGDTHLGGDDFDKLIVDFIANDFKANEGVDLRQDKQSLQRLTEAAEKAKIELSYTSTSEINLPFITATSDGPKHLDTSITRQQFEELSSPLIGRCFNAVEQALKDANTPFNEIDEIILVGGSTRMPTVEEMIFNKFGKKPNKTINPDETVALGAAIQAAVLSGQNKDVLLLDATPLSLGIRTESDRVSVLIPKNTTTPTKVTKTFATASDNQTSVKINIIQGENEYARNNKCLGVFTLSGLTPAPRGQTKVQVTFDVDANGILAVTAIDENTGKEQSITISEASRLEQTEIEEMKKDASGCTKSHSQTTKAKSRLVGSVLLEKVKEHCDEGDHSYLARLCGYVIQDEEGSELIQLEEFYEALVEAKEQTSTNKTPDTGDFNSEESMVENSEQSNDEANPRKNKSAELEYEKFWVDQTQNALKQGRSILGINLTDDKGDSINDNNGNPLAEFSYTYGNRQTGNAELLTFYPAPLTVQAVLNRLSKALEEGRLPYPKNHREMVCAEGLLKETSTVVMYYALDANQRAFTNKRYTTHHWQDEANIPILNVIVPLPDGNFAPGTPQPLMPTDQYTVVEASYEDSNWVKPKPNYLPRLIHEPDTENWGKANLKIIMNWIKDWTTDLLLAAAIDAKNNNTARKTIDWKDSFEWSLEELEKFDPDIAPMARKLDENTKRKIIEGVFAGLNGIALVDDHIELTMDI